MLLVKLVSLSALNQAVTISRQQIAVIVICISLILEVVLRMSDFDVKDDQDVLKAYLNGRFGAVPMIKGV